MALIIHNYIDTFIEIMKHFGPFMGFVMIIVESIIPILPLAVFIGFNIITFGTVVGFSISWSATVLGCLLSFYAFRKGFSKRLYKNTKVDGKIRRFMNYVTHFKFNQLVLLLAMPFTPAFAVNIASGLSKISAKKFILAIMIGKIAIVYFWGYIATSFIESISNPYILFKIGAIMVLTYVVSLVVQKILKISGV